MNEIFGHILFVFIVIFLSFIIGGAVMALLIDLIKGC